MKAQFKHLVKIYLDYDIHVMPYSNLLAFCREKFEDDSWDHCGITKHGSVVDFYFKNAEDALIFKISTNMVYNDRG